MRNKRLIILLCVVAALAVIVIACSATFLVRTVEAYNYYGYYENDDNYDKMVVDASGVKRNSSMFFLDESDVKKRVEGAFANVGVVNVERKFPDGVCINYVVYKRLFQYRVADKYCMCYSSGRIGTVSDEPSSGVFTLIPQQSVNAARGAYFQGSDGYDRKIVSSLVDVLHGKGLFDDHAIAGRIRFIDLTRKGYVYIRTEAGCSIELKCTQADFAEYFSYGYDIYAGLNEIARPDNFATSSGLIYVDRGSKGLISSYVADGGVYGNSLYTDEGYYASRYQSAHLE